MPVHVTVNRVELEPDTFAGLVSLRLPTDDELAAAGLTQGRRPTRLASAAAAAGPPRAARAAPAKATATSDRDHDVEVVDRAAGRCRPASRGPLPSAWAQAAATPARQSRRGGQRGQIGRRLRPVACHHRSSPGTRRRR